MCGTTLGYVTNLSHGKQRWKPFKVFHFIPPSASIRKMFQSKNFNTLLEKNSSNSVGILEDVQDGRIWKEFSNSNFFSNKFSLGLMLSVDWFRPFKRSEYKVAAIMLSVLNLPREERFKKKWTIIAGTTYNLPASLLESLLLIAQASSLVHMSLQSTSILS